jgi:pyruvate dehydrogenase E2 component (dihydrolipoamide acetyltransferase)
MTTTAVVREFRLPDLGEGLEDAEIVEWSVSVGDTVALNQTVCVVETAKATVDLPSPFAGRVVEKIGEPGETVPVGAVIVRVEVEGAASEGVASEDAEGAADPETPAADEPDAAAASPDAAPPILVGYGPDASSAGPRGRRLATPPVRRLARELGIDLTTLGPGSGPGGAILREDVQRAVANGGATTTGVADAPAPPVAWQEPPAAPARPATPASPSKHATPTEIPLRGVRARIAERMTVSRSEIPDASCAVEADASRLLEVRAELRAYAESHGTPEPVTPFALILRLVVAALGRTPIMNARLDTEAGVIRVLPDIHLGVALATDGGLLVPVVRDAGQRSTVELAREVARLAEAGRAGKLAPAELTGSTFTVSNFGAFGLDDGYPVINHPEAAILGVGSIRPRAVVVDDTVVARATVRLTCCFDHRICDGADAGTFLSDLRDLIESPTRLLLEA